MSPTSGRAAKRSEATRYAVHEDRAYSADYAAVTRDHSYIAHELQLTADRAIVHPDLPYLHIIHPLPDCPYPPTPDQLTELADKLAPVLMRSLDLAFDALRRAGLDRSQGWNLLMTE